MKPALTENRNGLVVDNRLTITSDTAKWEAALAMIENLPGTGRIIVGGDKGYDVPAFVNGLGLQATPHVAQKSRGKAIHRQTTRHEDYQVSQRVRKCLEEIFGWIKTPENLRKMIHRDLKKVEWMPSLATTAYNLVRMGT